MPQTPFPHILTAPGRSNDFTLRFVQPDQVIEGELLFEHSHIQENMKTRQMEPVYRVFLVKQILEARPARGQWGPYGLHPFYQHCIGESIGLRFKSDMNQAVDC